MYFIECNFCNVQKNRIFPKQKNCFINQKLQNIMNIKHCPQDILDYFFL